MASKFSHKALAAWYLKNKRDLPWRKNQDPYRVWISEIMLQQTQVANVIPYYLRFLKRFPNLKSLARAPRQRVLALWSGLGYYSRARNLHESAKIVLSKFRGVFPRTEQDLLSLPGIGPYTAGAVRSIAFDQPAGIFDGNVRRVLSRFYLSKDENFLKKISGAIVSEAHLMKIKPSDFNQALMELGALICAPANPECGLCPLKNSCRAKASGKQSQFPKSVKSRTAVKLNLVSAMLKSSSDPQKFLMVRRSYEQRLLKNIWGFPMFESANSSDLKSTESLFKRNLSLTVKLETMLGVVKHSVTHHQLKITVFTGHVAGNVKPLPPDAMWLRESQIHKISHSSILTKSLALLRKI